MIGRQRMAPRFTEADIAPSLLRFAQECGLQLAALGFSLPEVGGTFEVRLTDDPITDRSARQYGMVASVTKARSSQNPTGPSLMIRGYIFSLVRTGLPATSERQK